MVQIGNLPLPLPLLLLPCISYLQLSSHCYDHVFSIWTVVGREAMTPQGQRMEPPQLVRGRWQFAQSTVRAKARNPYWVC